MIAEPSLRDRAIDALGQALNASRYWLPVDGRPVAVDAVLTVTAAELETSERRAITLVERIGDARNWARQNLPPAQRLALLAILRGSQPASAGPDEHVCRPGAALYYCPTSGETESTCHSGHDTCCDGPDLHQLACSHCGGTGQDPEDPGDWVPEVGMHDPGSRQPCPECIQKGLPPRLPIPPHPAPAP